MHGLEINAILKLFTPLFINSNHACRNTILFLSGSHPISQDKIHVFLNIQDGFT